ncbi:N-acetylgalactosamine-N,N'-diacetylbacillosaminyl-diphospho-undecaprenol 4-alpha-N-acetylgalactosaminyltransferase [Flavobacterium swingsii]|uniref:N-acetylgalactosamine-N,N'-diacetylbacillosaminyl-diphospho-undecaprenol 4-alpha-N-acetylgalactosaminyltransferase n=1 Tax=Flavobacterium swingsii TaxID=498292 RepID=A0A1I0WIQ5_9FLAO|nr:glycosyltransferase [Flavobacterium swingsii]SFA88639.1 N-acetylgalactosamine-N,N'-diacetylbacillosaminyl-diphospho-undecaprenol 4-alpha-N-acetylgalactosaminyltransferase [Flavobacterium swingsii]
MILPHKKYKIALIGFSLGEGGGEKVMANLSIFFDKMGIEIHNIIVLDRVNYSYSGKLLNLGLLKNESNGFVNKCKRLLVLRKYLKANNFDFIIDFRPRTKYIQELILSKFIYKTKTILTVHSYLINYYMPKNKWLTNLIYKDCYATVTIVDKINELIKDRYNLKNLVTISNPIRLEDVYEKQNESLNIDYEYIIAVGQFENNVKQFDKLILSYSNSILPKNKIHLIILGKGNKQPLEKIAKESNIESLVHFLGYQENPYKFLKNAKFFVLSSLNEGLPNVILESLACQTPVIAFDCATGPREMIIDKNNGILVENQNLEKLTQAMNLFIEDTTLYNFCKKNALQSVQRFSLEIIGQQWLDLMKIKI